MIDKDWHTLDSAADGERGEDQQRIAQEVIRWGALLLRKNADYGSSVWKHPVLAEVGESIEDTIRDLGAYCLLLLAASKAGFEADGLPLCRECFVTSC